MKKGFTKLLPGFLSLLICVCFNTNTAYAEGLQFIHDENGNELNENDYSEMYLIDETKTATEDGFIIIDRFYSDNSSDGVETLIPSNSGRRTVCLHLMSG